MSEAEEIETAQAANTAFYHAVAEGDYPAMAQLWATTVPVVCVHPGAPALHGLREVTQSWRVILADPPGLTHSSSRVAIVRGLAFVTCLEHIGNRTLAASNIFVWEDRDWRLVLHQAGELPPLDTETSTAGNRLH